MITIIMVIIAVLKIIVNPIDACGSQSLDIPPQHVHGDKQIIGVDADAGDVVLVQNLLHHFRNCRSVSTINAEVCNVAYKQKQ